MNSIVSFSFSFSSVIVRTVVAVSVALAAVGCAASADEDPVASIDETAYESEPQTREHILLARPANTEDESTRLPATIDTITAAPNAERCGDGSTCTETSTKSCDDFRKNCKATTGCGTTSAGAGDIAVVSCIAIPTR